MDLSTYEIAAGSFGVVSVGTLIMCLMQIIKGFIPRLEGPWAEGTVVGVSVLVTVVIFVLAPGETDWGNEETYAMMFIVACALTIVARGAYAQLFKVSVVNVPPPPDAQAVMTTTEHTTETAHQYEYEYDIPVMRHNIHDMHATPDHDELVQAQAQIPVRATNWSARMTAPLVTGQPEAAAIP